MMELLTEILLIISNALLVPDIALLLIFMALTLFYMGGLTAEAVERLRHGGLLRKFIDDLKRSPERRIRLEDVSARFGFPAKVIPRCFIGAKEKWLDDTQLAMEASLARLNLGIRLGPILGLAGTLIPLGPALVGLSKGDINSLSQNLVVAFTTTVLGLFIGGVCYVMHTIRQKWYMQDMNDIEFVLKRME